MPMCSLAMPANYDNVLLSHPQQAFTHSPPIGNYQSYLRYDPLPARTGKPLTRRNTTPCSLAIAPRPTPTSAPRRPCLVVRPEDATAASSSDDDLPSPTRVKKKVVFADDKGMSLTQVRFMQEPSSVPPVWSMQFLAHVTSGISAEVAPDPWEVTFPQPASDYLDFRRRLDLGNVSLENVIVKETQEKVVGTVKVRNLSFNKEVLIRSSCDQWRTHEDAHCTYVNNNVSTAIVLYDTFSFRIPLPPRSRRIEFCVCFRCDGLEYWDNNNGKNYVLLKKNSARSEFEDGCGEKTPRPSSPEEAAMFRFPQGGKCTDAVYAKLDSWSEFASWNHLVNDSPYW